MSSSLSSFVDNLNIDIPPKYKDKKAKNNFSKECEECKNKFDYMDFEDNYMLLKCFHCNMDFINKFKNTYEFYNKDIGKFILLLRKGIFPYEYMDNWNRFDETKLPSIDKFYSNLKLENITDSDYRHANRVFKKFELKNIGEYHDLHVNSDTLF